MTSAFETFRFRFLNVVDMCPICVEEACKFVVTELEV